MWTVGSIVNEKFGRNQKDSCRPGAVRIPPDRNAARACETRANQAAPALIKSVARARGIPAGVTAPARRRGFRFNEYKSAEKRAQGEKTPARDWRTRLSHP